MHSVGFEPTRFTTPGLKSGSLDHSDKNAAYSIIKYYILIYIIIFILFYFYMFSVNYLSLRIIINILYIYEYHSLIYNY